MARRDGAGIGLKIGLMPTLFLIVAILYIARDILIPLAVAILLAFLLTPAATWLERRLLGRVLSIIVVVGAALAVLGTITWVLERQFVEVAAQLPNDRQNIQDKLRRVRGISDGPIGKAAHGVEVTLKSMASTNPSPNPSPPVRTTIEQSVKTPTESAPNSTGDQDYSDSWSWPKMLGQYSGEVFSPLATMGMILVFMIFLLGNRADLRDRILRLVGDARLHVTTQALDDAATRIIHYLLMQSAINAAYGVCVGVGLWIIGACSSEGRFPNVLLWSLLAMLLRFLPYLGPWLAAALPVVLSLAVFSNGTVFLETIGLYIGLEIVTSNVVEPWLYGASTGMSALAVLISAVFWTWLWGPVGLLLSTPLTVCLVVLGKYVPQLQFLAVLLGDEQALELSVRTYQRLLALDQEEAGDLVHPYRQKHGLERVFQEVMIPALVMAGRDRYFGKLDADREMFLWHAMRDLIEELGEAQKKQIGAGVPAAKSAATVLCLPAQNEADEIVGLMLAQLLQLTGQRVITASQVSLASEMLNLIEAQPSPVVCISALPPAALAHSRYLCKRIRNRFEDLPTVVGLWTSKTDPKMSLERLSGNGRARVVTTLAGALSEIREMVQPLVLQETGGI